MAQEPWPQIGAGTDPVIDSRISELVQALNRLERTTAAGMAMTSTGTVSLTAGAVVGYLTVTVDGTPRKIPLHAIS